MKILSFSRRYAGILASSNFLKKSLVQCFQFHYQFMQQSKLPTLHFQNSLPRLPVPNLKLTVERFLSAVQPVLDQEEYKRSVRMFLEFRNGDGTELQTLLEKSDKSNKHTSYISQPCSHFGRLGS